MKENDSNNDLYIQDEFQIKVNEIEDILIGKDCPHVKVKHRKQNFSKQVIQFIKMRHYNTNTDCTQKQ